MKTDQDSTKQRTAEERQYLSAYHKLTERYLAGECLTDEELSLLSKVTLSGKNISTEENPDEALKTKELVLKALRGRMNGPQCEHRSKSAHIGTIRSIRRYAAAAVLVLAVGIGGFMSWRNSQSVEIVFAAANRTETVTLPDGSRVCLNVGSRLTYDEKHFNRNRREVRLDGEAFFEVAKNPEKPFSVQSGGIVTTVRGTSFNVKAYAALNENVVSVRDGRVEVAAAERGLLGVLTQNQQITWNADTRTSRRDSIDWRAAAGWQDGTVLFNDAGLDEIALKVRQYYGIDLAADAVRNTDIHLCGTYPSDDGGAALLRQLEDIYGLKSENNGNRVILHR